MDTLKRINSEKLVAVIRGAKSEEDVLSIVDALYNGGIRIFEITVDTPEVMQIIKRISQKWEDEVIVGAGTVFDQETARLAIMAGAQFIFSPIVDKKTIQLTKRYGVVSIPGALTPTEILYAYEHGADIIKVFPANVVGPSYIKDLSGPLPHIPLMPTGGVDLSNFSEYLDSGSIAVGLGSSLVNTKKKLDEPSLKGIEKTALDFVNILKDVNRNDD